MSVFTATINGSITPAGALGKKVEVTPSGSITPATGLTGNRIKLAIISGSIQPLGSLSSPFRASINASISPAGQLLKKVETAIAGTITPSGSDSAHRQRTAVISGSITPSGALSKVLEHVLSGLITPAGHVSSMPKPAAINASITPSGIVRAGIGEVPCDLSLFELRLRTRELIDDEFGTYCTDAEVDLALNAMQRLFVLLTLCLEQTFSFTLTNGVAFQDLSAQIGNFLVVLRVGYMGLRVQPYTIHQLDMLSSTWRNTPGNPMKYIQAGFGQYGVLAITPQPASGTNHLDLTCAREPVPMVLDSDIPEIPQEHQPFLPKGAAFWLQLKVGGIELQNAAQYLQEFLMDAQKYQAFKRSKSRAQLYDIKPYDLASFDMGRFDFKVDKAKARNPRSPNTKGEIRPS